MQFSEGLSLTKPTWVDEAKTNLDSLASAADATLNAADGLLDSITTKLDYALDANEQSADTEATSLKSLLELHWSDFFSEEVRSFSADPFSPLPSELRGQFYKALSNKTIYGDVPTLSFEQLLKIFSAKLKDLADPSRPVFDQVTQMEMIVIAFASPTAKGFVQLAELVGLALQIPDFEFAKRRMQQELDLATNKLEIKPPLENESFQQSKLTRFNRFDSLQDNMEEALAIANSFGKGKASNIAQLKALIQAKKSQYGSLQSQWATLSSLLGISTTQGVYVGYSNQVSPSALQSELENASGGAKKGSNYAAGTMLIAPAPALTPFKTMLGL